MTETMNDSQIFSEIRSLLNDDLVRNWGVIQYYCHQASDEFYLNVLDPYINNFIDNYSKMDQKLLNFLLVPIVESSETFNLIKGFNDNPALISAALRLSIVRHVEIVGHYNTYIPKGIYTKDIYGNLQIPSVAHRQEKYDAYLGLTRAIDFLPENVVEYNDKQTSLFQQLLKEGSLSISLFGQVNNSGRLEGENIQVSRVSTNRAPQYYRLARVLDKELVSGFVALITCIKHFAPNIKYLTTLDFGWLFKLVALTGLPCETFKFIEYCRDEEVVENDAKMINGLNHALEDYVKYGGEICSSNTLQTLILAPSKYSSYDFRFRQMREKYDFTLISQWLLNNLSPHFKKNLKIRE